MSAIQVAFEAEMNSGRPIVDNAGHLYVIGEQQYDGPRCIDKDCDSPVDDDNTRCDDCAGRCSDCGREVSRPGLCFDCDVEGSYVGGLAPRFGAQP